MVLLILIAEVMPGEKTFKVVPRLHFPPYAIRLNSGWEYFYQPIGENALKSDVSPSLFSPGGDVG
jgi:hypothetical protein